MRPNAENGGVRELMRGDVVTYRAPFFRISWDDGASQDVTIEQLRLMLVDDDAAKGDATVPVPASSREDGAAVADAPAVVAAAPSVAAARPEEFLLLGSNVLRHPSRRGGGARPGVAAAPTAAAPAPAGRSSRTEVCQSRKSPSRDPPRRYSQP